ncbi:MAG: hypothetical protein F4X11_10085 [Acidobacteria bacterium]|nr:hypothetical protein [Acidobacteriota bacterium]
MTSEPHPTGPGRTAATFAAGALLSLVPPLLLLPALGALDLYRGATVLRPVVVVLFACAAGGVVAGGALGPGLRWRAAFGAAFGATLWIPLLILAGLPALSGVERLAELLLGFAPALAVTHALLGALGLALGGSGWRRASAGALVFGAAGTAGGVLLALVVRLAAGSSGAAAFAAGALGGGAACVLPLTLAGWWLGWMRSGRFTRATPRLVRGRARYGR